MEVKDKLEYSKVAIIGAITFGTSEQEVNISLDELTRLVDTAGGEVVIRMTQNLRSPNPATYIGEGKLEELSCLCRDNALELAVFLECIDVVATLWRLHQERILQGRHLYAHSR